MFRSEGAPAARGHAVLLAAAMALLLPVAACGAPAGEGGTPRPDHVVVVVEGDRSYRSVIGNDKAPYLNRLAEQGASLTEFYAVTRPGQPNYLALFSGSTQGVESNSCPHTFTSRNLASELVQADLTFAGYAQSMPENGYRGCRSGPYTRVHNPWVNFTNLPDSMNRTWKEFPSDFDDLPTVSFVIPDEKHDMHRGGVHRADTWLRENLGDYARWARHNNSLLVVTWDQDAGGRSATNHIPTVIVGEHVRPGANDDPGNHYDLLRTLLDAYELAPIDNTGVAEPLDVWKR